MKVLSARCAAAVACVLFPVVAAHAGTVHGTVKNGTTGKAAANVNMILIQLQGGMQPVANTKTDAQGQFLFDNPAVGAQPMLVRAEYRGVNFHQPLPPGTSDIQVEVFDPTQDPKAISVTSHVVIFQPNGAALTVGEEYTIQNNTQPPQAYFKTSGNFDFALPPQGKLQRAAAWGPSGMPVVQATMDKNDNRYAIAFAFRPGESGVRYSYEVPYPGNATTVKVPTIYPAARLLVVAPPSVQIAGDGLQAGGQEQGMSVYGRDNLPANTALAVSVSGTAPPQSSGSSGGDSGSAGSEAQGGSQNVVVQQVPGRLDVLKWPLIGGFAGLFTLGAILLARRPVAASVMVDADPREGAVRANRAKFSKAPADGENAGKTPAPAPAMAAESSALASVDAAVGVSLDSLKDQLFRLELRRQAGTITEEEYARERARTEKVLRDLVRG